MIPEFQTLKVSLVENVLTVRLNRPSARNAMNLRMCEEVMDLFARLQDRSDEFIVVIGAEGSAFCAGVDLKELAAQDDDWVLNRRYVGLDAFLAIEACPYPVICMVDGPAIGAGCEIAAACDFVVASDRTFFQWPEALRGSVGATQRLPRVVGPAMAKELLFTARKISAEEARLIGFVNRVVAFKELQTEVANYVKAISSCSNTAIRLVKEAIDSGESLDRTSAVDIERELIQRSIRRSDWRSGIAEFS